MQMTASGRWSNSSAKFSGKTRPSPVRDKGSSFTVEDWSGMVSGEGFMGKDRLKYIWLIAAGQSLSDASGPETKENPAEVRFSGLIFKLRDSCLH